MDCTAARIWLFRKIDGELSPADCALLDSHLAQCPGCTRELRLLSIPRRIGLAIPALEPSPYFYRKLRARIESEAQGITIWQILLGLSRQVVPALAAITLALLSIFAYLQIHASSPDVYQTYDRMFISSDRPLRMVQGDITNESVLNAIADQESSHRVGTETSGKK
ncbi:MAG TPA: zf-HC2 domain-containing protein [Acidobacteriota bacterium]|nr:zf-HC2 domain-containing protein [Acidobacteriota bacterium]